jgi:hypothetical protein
MNIRVANLNTYVPKEGEISFYVGSKKSAHRIPDNVIDLSVLENPYPISSLEDRKIICGMYEIGLENMIVDKAEVAGAIEVIIDTYKTNDVALLCWCKPLQCHADSIREIVKKLHKHDESIVSSFEIEQYMDRAIYYGAIDEEIDNSIAHRIKEINF